MVLNRINSRDIAVLVFTDDRGMYIKGFKSLLSILHGYYKYLPVMVAP